MSITKRTPAQLVCQHEWQRDSQGIVDLYRSQCQNCGAVATIRDFPDVVLEKLNDHY